MSKFLLPTILAALTLTLLTALVQGSLPTAQSSVNRLTYLVQDSATFQYKWESEVEWRRQKGLPLYENRADTTVVLNGLEEMIVLIDSSTCKNSYLINYRTFTVTFNEHFVCFGAPDELGHKFYNLDQQTFSNLVWLPDQGFTVTFQSDLLKFLHRDTAKVFNVRTDLAQRRTFAGQEGHWVSFERTVNDDTEVTRMYVAPAVNFQTHLFAECPADWRGLPIYVEVFSKKTPRNKHFLTLLNAEQLPAEEADAYLNKYYQFTQKK